MATTPKELHRQLDFLIGMISECAHPKLDGCLCRTCGRRVVTFEAMVRRFAMDRTAEKFAAAKKRKR